MADWVGFWDTDHPIYVNARHREVHNALIAADIRSHLPAGSPVVLDYGCGEALHAPLIAPATGRLILCDAAPKLLAALRARYASDGRIEAHSPDEIAALPDGSLDVVVMQSVAQYLSPEEADRLFVLFRRLLKPDGLFMLGDIIQPDVSAIREIITLLRFAAANGFLFAALRGLVRTALSDYPKLRSSLGLTRYSEADMFAKLRRAGFSTSRADKNVGHDQARMTFISRPAQS